MIARLTLFFVLTCCLLPVSAQEESAIQQLSLPGFGYLGFDNSFWSGGWWDNPYAPTLVNIDGSLRLRIQSGDTLETPLTVETVGTDPLDALAALDLDLINRPGWITLGREGESTLKALIVEAKVGEDERLMDEDTNRLLVLALPPHQNNWYLITSDNIASMWTLNKPAIYSEIKSFHYVPNAPLLRVVLAYDLPEGLLTRQHELAALDVISRRLHSLELETPFATHLMPDHTLEIGFYGAVKDVAGLAEWLTQGGFFELVDFSDVEDPDAYLNTLIQTTGRQTWMADDAVVTADITSEEAALNPSTSAPFDSILTSLMLSGAATSHPPSANAWHLELTVVDEVEDTIRAFGNEHSGKALGVVIDGMVLDMLHIGKDVSFESVIFSDSDAPIFEKVHLWEGLEEDALQRYESIINSGPLPVPLTVQTIELLE